MPSPLATSEGDGVHDGGCNRCHEEVVAVRPRNLPERASPLSNPNLTSLCFGWIPSVVGMDYSSHLILVSIPCVRGWRVLNHGRGEPTAVHPMRTGKAGGWEYSPLLISCPSHAYGDGGLEGKLGIERTQSVPSVRGWREQPARATGDRTVRPKRTGMAGRLAQRRR
jgi:hypothetical protein